jgi:hypothetical protein
MSRTMVERGPDKSSNDGYSSSFIMMTSGDREEEPTFQEGVEFFSKF